MQKEGYMNDHEMKTLEEITAQIDYLFQEGVRFNSAEAKTIEACAGYLRRISYEIQINLAHAAHNPII